LIPAPGKLEDEARRLAANHFRPARPQAIHFQANVGIASDIDDEVGGIGFQEFSVVSGNRQAEFPGENDAGRAFIFVGDSDNLDARILVE
jgi:hypothetical protein